MGKTETIIDSDGEDDDDIVKQILEEQYQIHQDEVLRNKLQLEQDDLDKELLKKSQTTNRTDSKNHDEVLRKRLQVEQDDLEKNLLKTAQNTTSTDSKNPAETTFDTMSSDIIGIDDFEAKILKKTQAENNTTMRDVEEQFDRLQMQAAQLISEDLEKKRLGIDDFEAKILKKTHAENNTTMRDVEGQFDRLQTQAAQVISEDLEKQRLDAGRQEDDVSMNRIHTYATGNESTVRSN